MMSHVSSHTSIPIPKVRRVLSVEPSDPECEEWWIVMDYIDGDVLESAWKTMTTWRRLSIMWSVRRYIHELQKIPLPNPDVPGPFDACGKSYICNGFYFSGRMALALSIPIPRWQHGLTADALTP